jgi:outer membrane protein assembly factor BamB
MKKVLVLGVVALLIASARADNWPQWRGPDRTDVSKETGLLKAWPPAGPARPWVYKEAGIGYSGFSIVGETLYTMGARGNTEYLIAINVKDGKEKWATEIGGRLGNRYGDGPRGTPTVDGEQIYTMSGEGNLVCAGVKDGKVEWKVSMSDLGGRRPGWGFCESPLIDGDRCLCTPGGRKGAIAALEKKTGKVIWQSKGFTEGAQYSSIIAYNHNGRRQYCQLTMRKVVGLDAGTGDVLWTSDFPGRIAVIPTPIYHDGHVFVTAGYNAGCKLLKLEQNGATEVYANKDLTNQHGGVVLVGEHLYGYSDRGGWTCMEFKTGKVVWKEARKLRKGCLTCAAGMFYLMDERAGEVVMIEASPAGWKEHGRFKLEAQSDERSSSGGIWTHPVVANGKLYLRDQEMLSCYDVKAR